MRAGNTRTRGRDEVLPADFKGMGRDDYWAGREAD
jgi:hypothetical protein